MLEQLPILSMILFSPLLGALIILCLPKRSGKIIRSVALIAALVTLILAAWLYADYDKLDQGAPYEEQAVWIQVPLDKTMFPEASSYTFQLNYHLAVDGLSLPLLFLTALVAMMAALASIYINKRWKAFYLWFLLLETGMLGVFLAKDLFLFFIFFEITLVPVFFLIGIWGGQKRDKAANQFLIYNGIGSAIMLIAFLILVSTAGFTVDQSNPNELHLAYSADYNTIVNNLKDADSYANAGPDQLPGNPFHLSERLGWAVLLLLLIAFGIKLPMFPFHTWMLRVHVEAPPSVVMIHSGILLKMGAYGLIRFGVFLFPEQVHQAAIALGILGLINLLYGAVLAFVQKDFKLVLAYSSISHMGIVLLGIAALNEAGLQGAAYQMVSHGLISALLFLIVGLVYERTGTSMLDQLGGLAKAAPFTAGILLIGGLASLGLPGLAGFVSEFMTFLGLFGTMQTIALIGLLGVILSAVYMLRGVLRISFGSVSAGLAGRNDATLIEAVPMIALVAFIVLLGIYPSILLDPLQNSFDSFLQSAAAKTGG